jgi:hypothetical protein
VITGNPRAIRTYQRAGFQATRDLRILTRAADATPGGGRDARVREADAEALLQRALVDRPTQPPWQREPAALAHYADLQALALDDSLAPPAFALFTVSERSVSLGDLVAHNAADARLLLDALAGAYPGRSMSILNLPADDPANPAFDAAGFTEPLRQHEMRVEVG